MTEAPIDQARQTYLYVTYIRAKPEAVFAALTSNEVRPWWFNRLVVGDYKVGGELVQYSNPEKNGVDFRSTVLEFEPPTKLVTTFWVEGPGPQHDAGPTTVTYDIIPLAGGGVKLMVTHEGLVTGLYNGVSKGWPAIMAMLKTQLETGGALGLLHDEQFINQ
jgi:uncharacterized protein YndB with AHSA1/START domain